MALTKVSGDFIQDGSITQGHLHASHGITTSDIGEGSNLYFTTARVDSRIGDLSTSDLSEGTNLYYTDARVGSYLTTNNYLTASSTHTLTNKSGNISQWTNDSGYITDGNTNWDNSYGFITASSTETLTNKSGNISMFTNDSGYITDGNTNWNNSYGFITASSTDTLTNKSGNISQWTNDSGYITGYTESDTLATVTARGASTTSNITTGTITANVSGTGVLDIESAGTNAVYIRSGASDELYIGANGTYQLRFQTSGHIVMDNGGYLQSNASLRAPIFYDSNNTAYYSNPASTSVLSDISADGVNADHLNLGGATGDNGEDLKVGGIRGRFTNELIHMYNRVHIGTPSGWAAQSAPIYGLSVYGGVELATNTSYTTSGGSMRAPVFYDSNNTGYYVDPAGTSVLNRVELNGQLDMRAQTGTWVQSNVMSDAIGWNTSHGAYIGSNVGGTHYLRGNGKITTGGGTYNLWHQGNDGSGSGLDADLLDGKDHTNFGATLATYGTTAGSSGRIRCTAPFNTNSAHMFQIMISLYGSYTQHTYIVSAYMYPNTNQWYSPKAIYLGTGSPDIIVGRDANGKAYISIANGNYMGVRVHNMTRGYQTSVADTYDPWTITVDAGTENSVTPSIYETWTSGNDGSGSGLDADLLDGVQGSSFLRSDVADTNSVSITAPIYYDTNTAYYLNANGTSNLNSTFADAFLGRVTTSGDGQSNYPFRLASDYNAYMVATASNTWGLFWAGNSGARYGTNGNGGPGNIWSNSTNPNEFAFVGSDSTAWTVHGSSGNVWLKGYGTAAGSYRAPIFYDSNNTGYFVDPASTTNLNGLNTNSGDITATHFGIANTSTGTRDGIALYGGAGGGEPTYGLLFTGTSGLGTHGGVTSNWSTYFTMNDNSSRGWIFRRVGSGNSASISAGGLATFDDSVRSPIFYDSNNTGYYIDANNTSNIYRIQAQQFIASDWLRTTGNAGWYSNTHGGGMWMEDSTYVRVYGDKRLYNPNTSHLSIYTAGGVTSTNQMRSPIYYDYNNTAYYTRPSTSSYINSLHTAGNIQAGSSGTGNIYIGGTSGNYFRFHTNNSHTYFDANVGNIYWRQGSSTRFYFYMTTSNITINGTLTQNSDERVKENIVEIPNALEKINAMRGIYYNRTDTNTEVKKIGVIAQEVEAVLPEVILEAPDTGLKSVAYAELTAVLINGIKEQQAIIDDLKSRLETLENQ